MSGTYPFRNYRIFFTPLVGENVYGTTADVTQDVDMTDFVKNFGSITREIDNGDYDFGIFTFGDITLQAIDHSRVFSEPTCPDSMFKFRRDRCKVEVVFYDESGTAYTRFKGLINDDATLLDLKTSIVRFKVLSLDSIFRQVQVSPGAIVSGDLFSVAIKKILNVPEVTSTLTYSPANVVVNLDLEIDDGEVFTAMSAKEALDALLLASNSIMYVDNNDAIQVKARRESANSFPLYGHGDLYGRENVLQVDDYNNGLHRAFSSIMVNDRTYSTSDAWVAQYGFKQKSVTLNFITTVAKEQQIADRLLAEFKVPKREMQLTAITSAVQNIEMLDYVTLDWNYRLAPYPGDDTVPMWGAVEWGAFNWPKEIGPIRIHPDVIWKVIGIDEDPVKFTTRLKLRHAGILTSDGYDENGAAAVEWGDGTAVTWGDGTAVEWSES